MKQYGDDLICVRYRNDFKRKKRLKTKVWKLPYKEVLELGLEKRIVT